MGHESYDYVSSYSIVKTDKYKGLNNFNVIYTRKEKVMKRYLLLAVVLISAISGPTFGAIVYSGSQNVTLTLSPMDSMMSMTFHIADEQTEQWDDFKVDLWYDDTMGMSHLAIYGPMSMDPMGMGIMGIVGFSFLEPASGLLLPFASNLAPDEEIGENSPMVGWGYLTNTGHGEFYAEGGYIGLMMDNPGGSPHYGWLHVSDQWDIGFDTHSFTIDGWAYEDEAGRSIGAGVVPVPGALVLGGLGIGFAAWRLRRRREL